jgi:hypothetical protein
MKKRGATLKIDPAKAGFTSELEELASRNKNIILTSGL